MQVGKRSRAELKQYFVKNAIPTESQFAELIDGMLSQQDDGLAKLPNDALSIEAAGDDTSQKKAIHFYNSFSDASPTWVLSLNPRQDPGAAATARAGFSISDSGGNSRLFIERDTGKVGVGTTTPRGRLDVTTGDVWLGQALHISAASDGLNAGHFNFHNETNKKYWHITHRAGEDDKLIFWRNDDTSDPWLPVMKLGMDGLVEVQGMVSVYATNRTWNTWLEAIRFTNPSHSAITHPGGRLLFGMHSDRNFYFSDTEAGRHMAVISPQTGGSLSIGTGEAPLHALQVQTAVNDWAARIENRSSNSNVLLSHGGGYGMHVRADTTTTTNYLLELYNGSLEGAMLVVSTGGETFIRKTLAVNGTISAPAGLIFEGSVPHIERDGAIYRHADGQCYLTVDDHLFIRKANTATWAAHFDTNDGSLTLMGNLAAGTVALGNSDIYFTNTEHNHTGMGNASGRAAIENAKDTDSLMILGRAGTSVGRKVRLWDYLNVEGVLANLSDATTKQDIASLEYGLAEVKKLRPIAFNWINRPNPHKTLGLVGQEVQEVIKEVAYEDDGKVSISYLCLVPVLINAIKELDRKIEALSS